MNRARWKVFDSAAKRMLRGTMWGGEYALARRFWANVQQAGLADFDDAIQFQRVIATFAALILFIREPDARGAVLELDNEHYHHSSIVGKLKSDTWDALIRDLPWNLFRLGQLFGPSFDDESGEDDPYFFKESNSLERSAIENIICEQMPRLIACLVDGIGSIHHLILLLRQKDSIEDVIDYIDDFVNAVPKLEAISEEAYESESRVNWLELRKPSELAMNMIMLGGHVNQTQYISPTNTSPVEHSPQPNLYDRPELTWLEIEDVAKQLFDYYSIHRSGICFGRVAWRTVRLRGLTHFSHELERHKVLIRLLSIGLLYQSFNEVTWEEADPDEVSIPWETWLENTNVDRIRLGQLVGTDFEVDDDIKDTFDHALMHLARASMHETAGVLKRDLGEGNLFWLLYQTDELADLEAAIVGSFDSEERDWEYLEGNAMEAYEWLRSL